ncbi:hypothetical protein F511_10570 [Dorcoceras hygrometricum]|uniref:Stress up-regulated Nod 19 protein n=1 Tax=Dorcoceras hygrometricum TaxID=472368 RepID=A0A2Z7CJH1_9LAMI|nr:hypothetical protein F511_10570 [Dorcoceras hygrometricum]
MFMQSSSSCAMFNLCIFLLLLFLLGSAKAETKNEVKTKVYLSPKIELGPGMVSNKNYPAIDFPQGHVAIKSFDAELVDQDGNPVPLYQTYLHHWILIKYYQPIHNSTLPPIIFGNVSGVCNGNSLISLGSGSETRKTLSHVPDPYGIVVGNPSDAPAGYEEKWLLNVHAIDTRGVVDKLGCLECTCDLYNVTTDEDGKPLPPDYYGGMRCCRDGTRCSLKGGYNKGGNITYYLKYTVRYMDWDPSIVPVRLFVLDVTDIVTKANGSQGIVYQHDCQVEYQVKKSCSNITDFAKNGCTDTKSVSFSFPVGGKLVYGVGHLHVGGVSIAIHGQDGRDICTSTTIYGKGTKAGNEAGYVVGMSTCYPKPGSVKIGGGETITLVSKYNSARRHAGVMGLFNILLADS